VSTLMPEPPPDAKRELEELSRAILDACIDVQNRLGHRRRESAYRRELELTLSRRGLRFRREVAIPIPHGGPGSCGHADFLIRGDSDEMLLEAKARENLEPEDVARSLIHLHQGNYQLCLLVNFGVRPIGVRRFTHAARDRSGSEAPESKG
jgi:GxxExxY protein